MASISAPVLQAIAAIAQTHELDVEDVQLLSQGRQQVLDVMLDRDGGIDLELTATVSHEISAALDQEGVSSSLPDGFILQVGSPGVDRPLTLERHWRRAARRLVEVHPNTGDVFTDRIAAVADGVVNFASHEPLALADIDHGSVCVEFTEH